jgi:hypothetical protein
MTSKRTINTVKKIARDLFIEVDTRTRVSSPPKKVYSRKIKHKKPLD